MTCPPPALLDCATHRAPRPQGVAERTTDLELDNQGSTHINLATLGTSLAVQWLRPCAPNAGSTGLIPGRGTKIPHAAWCAPLPQKKTQKPNQKNFATLRRFLTLSAFNFLKWIFQYYLSKN